VGAKTETEKRSFAEGCKFVAKVGKEHRALQAKSLRFYKQALMEGMTEDEAFAHAIERLGSLGLTERKLRNYLERKNSTNPKADAMTSGIRLRKSRRSPGREHPNGPRDYHSSRPACCFSSARPTSLTDTSNQSEP
jgi:hypothetical protein